MKKRILIALIVLILCAGLGVGLYFILRNKNMDNTQATNLVSRISIDIGAIADYEGSPKREDIVKGNGEDNIINSNPVVDISDIIAAAITEAYTNSGNDFQGLESEILVINSLLKTAKAEQNKVYQSKTTLNKYLFTTTEDEVLITIKATQGQDSITAYFSFFYDSKDNEYEIIQVINTNQNTIIFNRIKANSEGLLSVERYGLINLTNENISTAINNGEGTSFLNVYDLKNGTYKHIDFSKTTSADDHFVLSSYVYQIYTNFADKLADNLKKINEETKPTEVNIG